MHRIMLGLAVAGLALGLSPAHAGVTTTAGFVRSANIEFFNYDVMTDTQHMGGVFILSVVGGSSSGATATPTADFLAGGYDRLCDNTGCINYEFPTQVVSPAALNMDALGNTAQFQACLFPTSGPCRTFNLTLARPEFLSPQYCFPLLACVVLNPWFDPATTSAKVSAFEGIGLYRANYTVAGTFNSNPFPIGAEFIGTTTIQSINATQIVTAP